MLCHHTRTHNTVDVIHSKWANELLVFELNQVLKCFLVFFGHRLHWQPSSSWTLWECSNSSKTFLFCGGPAKSNWLVCVRLFMTTSVNLQKSLATSCVNKDFDRSTSCFTPSGHLAGSLCSIGVIGAGLWSSGGHHVRLNDSHLQNTKVLLR